MTLKIKSEGGIFRKRPCVDCSAETQHEILSEDGKTLAVCLECGSETEILK